MAFILVSIFLNQATIRPGGIPTDPSGTLLRRAQSILTLPVDPLSDQGNHPLKAKGTWRRVVYYEGQLHFRGLTFQNRCLFSSTASPCFKPFPASIRARRIHRPFLEAALQQVKVSQRQRLFPRLDTVDFALSKRPNCVAINAATKMVYLSTQTNPNILNLKYRFVMVPGC